MAVWVCNSMLPALLYNPAPCPCASLLSQRARCGWIRERALPTHPAGDALPRVPRPQERGKCKMWGGSRIWSLKMEVNHRRWRKILKTTKTALRVLAWRRRCSLLEGKGADPLLSFLHLIVLLCWRSRATIKYKLFVWADGCTNPVPF